MTTRDHFSIRYGAPFSTAPLCVACSTYPLFAPLPTDIHSNALAAVNPKQHFYYPPSLSLVGRSFSEFSITVALWRRCSWVVSRQSQSLSGASAWHCGRLRARKAASQRGHERSSLLPCETPASCPCFQPMTSWVRETEAVRRSVDDGGRKLESVRVIKNWKGTVLCF